MRKIAFLVALMCSIGASAGSFEDLEEAIIRGNSSAAVALIERGVDVNSVDRFGNSLLVQAVKRDMPEFFDYLVAHRARLNLRNKNGESALSIAAYLGKLTYVEKLVQAGAEVNVYGWPPLVYAAYNGHDNVVDYLLNHGADVDSRAENGATAIFFAARFGHMAVVKKLIANDATLSITNDQGDTAVDWAMKAGNTDIADLMRDSGGRSGHSVVIDFSK